MGSHHETVQHTPGLLAHGGYPFIVRGLIGTVFFMPGPEHTPTWRVRRAGLFMGLSKWVNFWGI